MTNLSLSRRQSEILLLLLTLIWGISFPVTRILLEHNSVMTILFIRFAVAAIVTHALQPRALQKLRYSQYSAGIVLGFILFASFYLQTLGLKYTTSSRGAFLTALYVVIVPLVAYPFLKERPHRHTVAALFLAFAGVGVLSFDTKTAAQITGATLDNVRLGDSLVFTSSLMFAFHIVLVTKYSKILTAMASGLMQLWIVAGGALFACLIWRKPLLPYPADWPLLLFFSIIGTGLALIAQIVAQKNTTATSAGIIFSLEPVMATFFGLLILNEPITPKTMIGAAFFFTAVALTILTSKSVSETK